MPWSRSGLFGGSWAGTSAVPVPVPVLVMIEVLVLAVVLVGVVGCGTPVAPLVGAGAPIGNRPGVGFPQGVVARGGFAEAPAEVPRVPVVMPRYAVVDLYAWRVVALDGLASRFDGAGASSGSRHQTGGVGGWAAVVEAVVGLVRSRSHPEHAGLEVEDRGTDGGVGGVGVFHEPDLVQGLPVAGALPLQLAIAEELPERRARVGEVGDPAQREHGHALVDQPVVHHYSLVGADKPVAPPLEPLPNGSSDQEEPGPPEDIDEWTEGGCQEVVECENHEEPGNGGCNRLGNLGPVLALGNNQLLVGQQVPMQLTVAEPFVEVGPRHDDGLVVRKDGVEKGCDVLGCLDYQVPGVLEHVRSD